VKLPPLSSLALGAISLALAACAAAPGQPATKATLAIRNATVIDGTGAAPLKDMTILIDGDRIVAMGPTAATVIASGARVIDAAGKTVMPGLISNHSHVGIVAGVKSSPDNYNRAHILGQLQQFEALGITTVTSLGLNGPLFYQLRGELHAGTAPGSDLFGADRGIGVEAGAPPANIVSIGGDQIYRPSNPDEARTAVREMAARRTDLVKVWLDDFGKSLPIKVAPGTYAAIVDEAHKNNLRVAAHIHDMDDAKAILGVGGDILAHGVRDKPVDAEFIRVMKERKAWYIATLALDDANFIYAERPELVSDPVLSRWMNPAVKALISDPAWRARVMASPAAQSAKRDLAMNKANLLAVHKAGIPIGFGSDSGVGLRIPGLAEHRELTLMVEAGLTPLESIAIATSNAARLLKLEDRGVLRAGMLADLVVLDASPLDDIGNTLKINSVVHRGRVVPRDVTAASL